MVNKLMVKLSRQLHFQLRRESQKIWLRVQLWQKLNISRKFKILSIKDFQVLKLKMLKRLAVIMNSLI